MVQGTSYTNDQTFRMFPIMTGHITYHEKYTVPRQLTTYTECPRRNGQNFGRVFLMLKYTDITQNTYIQS